MNQVKTPVFELMDEIMQRLPHEPGDCIWTNMNEILCPSGEDCRNTAFLLKEILSEWGYVNVMTGYYDSDKDFQQGKQEKLNGYWYVRLG